MRVQVLRDLGYATSRNFATAGHMYGVTIFDVSGQPGCLSFVFSEILVILILASVTTSSLAQFHNYATLHVLLDK